jgi:hypothetical protein
VDDVLDRLRPLLILGNPDGPLSLVLVNSTWKTLLNSYKLFL